MAEGFALNLDVSQLAKAEQKLEKMVQHSAQIHQNLNSAFNLFNASKVNEMISRISSDINKLNQQKVTLDFNSSKANEFYSIIDNITQTIKTLTTQQRPIELFNTQSIYASNKGLAETSAAVNSIKDKMESLKTEWKELENFTAPINPKTGKAFGVDTKAYQQARAMYKENIEAQLQSLIEAKAIADKELQYSKMTQDEKLVYVQKELQKELNINQKHINDIRKEYSQLINDQIDLIRKRNTAEKEGSGTQGANAIKEYERQFESRDKRRREIEQNYGTFVVDIAEKAHRTELDISVRTTTAANKERVKEAEKTKNQEIALYKETINEILSLSKRIETNISKNKGGSLTSVIQGQNARLYELNKQRLELEQKLGDEISKEKAKFAANNLDVEAYAIKQTNQIREAANKERVRTEQQTQRELLQEYKANLNEMVSLEKKYKKNEFKNTDGSLDAVIAAQKQRFVELSKINNEIRQLFNNKTLIQSQKADDKRSSSRLDIEADRIKEEMKLREQQHKEEMRFEEEYEKTKQRDHDQEIKRLEREIQLKLQQKARMVEVEELRQKLAKEREAAEWEQYKKSPEGALTLAKDAKTINDMKEAQKYLQEARGNADVKNVDLIKQLNGEYTRLRAEIEKLTTAEKNEQSLQPTLRNEYERLLKQLDKIREARIALSKTSAFQRGDKQARADYAALVSQEQVLANRQIEIRTNASVLASDVEKKHAADVAMYRVAETEKAEAKIAEIARRRFQEQLSMNSKYGNISSASVGRMIGIASGATNAVQEEAAIKKLLEAKRHLNTNDVNYEQTVKRLDAAIARHKRTLDELTRSAEENANAYERRKKAVQDKWFTSNADRALNFSKSTKSINEQIRAIEYLKQARNNLDKTRLSDVEYVRQMQKLNAEIKRQQDEVDKLVGKQSKLAQSHRGLMDTAGQLARKIALLFSVSAIEGYINKLRTVRGEFEMQQKSLQVLLQNKDEADKLWNQTVELAVKSPFRVSELVRYTRQLAAYRIETEKLHDTTKRLADVSSGLGVDMQRLILAFGQVRAANFLRGTELRQFTEAGIPLLDELAKYFTELEGRAISAGDVFERISKRMVSFGDVEEVFHRMTDAGGTFYRMQEEQSKTLQGMYSNLHDSIDLMLNDIGKANDGVLKNVISTLTTFVGKWQDVTDAGEMWLKVLSPIITYTLLAKAANSKFALSLLSVVNNTKTGLATSMAYGRWLAGLEKSSKLAAWGVRGLTTALRGLATLGIAGAVIGIVTAITNLYLETTKAEREAKRLKKALSEILVSDNSKLQEAIDGYKDLTTRLEQANKGSQARKDIISKLNSQYGEYLNFVVTEETAINDLASAYEDVVKRMKEKQALTSFEKGMEAIAQSYGDSLKSAKEDFYEMFSGASIKSTKSDFSLIVPKKEDIDRIYALVQQRTREMSAEQFDDLTEQAKLIQEIVSGYYGEEFYLSRDFANSIDLLDILVRRKKAEAELQQDINAMYKETLSSREANLALEKLQNEYAQKRKDIENSGVSNFDINKQLSELATQEKLDVIDLKVRFNIITEESGEQQKNAIINWATDISKSINETITKELGNSFSEEDLAKVLITPDMQSMQSTSEYVKDIAASWELQNSIIAEQISLKSEGLNVDETLLNNAIRLEELYRKVAEILGIELKYEKRINEETRKSINNKLPLEYQITLEESLKSQATLLEEANKKKEESIKLQAMLNAAQAQGTHISEEELKKIEEDVKFWTERWKLLGGTEKDKGNNARSNSLYDERIKVIDDMNKKYKELNKTLSQSEALQGAFEAYIDSFATAYEGISWVPANMREMSPQEFASKVLNFPNENDLVRFLDKLSKEPMKTFEKIKVELAKGEYVYDMKVRAKVEEDKALIDQIEEMFSGYELSLELQKLNIPPDLAKQLFGIDTIDLSGLKSRVEGLQTLFLGTDMEGKYKEYLQKISEMEDKEQVERLKSYTKYIVKAQSERTRITFEALEKIRKAEEMYQQGKFTKSEMNNIRENINKERDKELADLAFNEFKNSDLYLKMFEDFDSVSIPVLESMKKRVENLRNSLKELGASSEDVKNLTQQLEKIDDAIQERSPFKDLFKNIKEYRKLQGERDKTESEYKEKLEENEKLTKALAEASKEVGTAKSEYNKAMEKATENQALKNAQSELDVAKARLAVEINANGAETQKAIALQQEVEKKQQAYDVTYKTLVLEDKSVKTAKERLDNANKAEESAKNALNKSNTDLSALLKKLKEMEELSEKIASTLQFVGQVFQELASTVTDVASSLENVFGAMDAKTSDTVSSISEILGGLGNTASGVGRVMANPMDIGGYFQAVSGLASTIGSIFAIGDKKKERQIQREIKFVEGLEKAYEKLEKQIDEAYTIDTLKRSYDNAQKNLDEQIAARERMIALEEDKKKTDSEKIKQYQQEIEDLREQQEELLKSQVEELGGGYDYSSMTEEFVDAWLSAYEEAGDGLKGLEDNFDDFFKNIAIKQAVMGGASKILEPFFNEVNKALEDDFKLDDSEMATIDRLGEQAKVNLDDFLKQWYGKWGEYMGGEGQGELSGLQRGIASASEATMQAVEAYLNSIRFFVAEQNTYLAQIAANFGNTEIENPMVSQLRIIAQQTSAINTLLNSLVKGGHTLGGQGLKVFIS